METNSNENNNQLQKSDTKIINQLLVIKNEPLLYYPELKDSDVHNCNVISKEEKQIIFASLNFPKIRTLEIVLGNQNFYDLSKIIGKSIWDMGITEKSMTQEEQEMFIPVAIEEIQTDFSNLSIEDIRIAFKKGARRHYGEFYQMSITTINCWLNAYIEETKPTAMQRLPHIKPQIEAPKEISEEEKLKRHKDWLENIYKKFEEHKKTNRYDYYDFNNVLFNYLKKIGIINLTAEQQEKIWDMAVKELKSEYHPKHGRNFGQRIDLKTIYDNLKLDEIDKKTNELIVIRAKRIAIKTYFRKLIREAKHIRDEIEDAEKKYLEKLKQNENTDTNNNSEGIPDNSGG
jgi:hypothetical protein